MKTYSGHRCSTLSLDSHVDDNIYIFSPYTLFMTFQFAGLENQESSSDEEHKENEALVCIKYNIGTVYFSRIRSPGHVFSVVLFGFIFACIKRMIKAIRYNVGQTQVFGNLCFLLWCYIRFLNVYQFLSGNLFGSRRQAYRRG